VFKQLQVKGQNRTSVSLCVCSFSLLMLICDVEDRSSAVFPVWLVLSCSRTHTDYQPVFNALLRWPQSQNRIYRFELLLISRLSHSNLPKSSQTAPDWQNTCRLNSRITALNNRKHYRRIAWFFGSCINQTGNANNLNNYYTVKKKNIEVVHKYAGMSMFYKKIIFQFF